MRLLTAHKILIGSALGLAILLMARAAWLYAARRSSTDAAMGALSVLLAVALATYLRRLFRR
ncbi:MAG TPA: hypothetical protein VGL13_11695 [Polyangiaceae bacterium]